MQQMLDAAVEYVEERTRPLSPKTVTVRAAANNRYLTLPAWDITQVVSLTDPVGATVDLSVGSAVNLDAGIIALPYLYPGIWSPWVPGYWQVVVVVGDNNPPVRFVLAAILIAAQLWRSRDGWDTQAGPPSISGGRTPAGFAIPNQAAELLGSGTLPAFA